MQQAEPLSVLEHGIERLRLPALPGGPLLDQRQADGTMGGGPKA
jgi:hypothetical protein